MTRTIVMTGGTSGFGAIAAERLRQAGDVRLILGARRAAGAIPLDLADLASVRAFADTLEGTPIDALVLNAGIVRPDADARTVDGFETTFAVNHLSQYLLLRLLLPAMADRATVVLTTSGTHDPAARAGLTPPRHADAELLAHPDQDPGLDPRPRHAGEHAYTAAKLCAVLTARSLAERRFTAVAFCPGQVFGTGLAKDLSRPWRIAWRVLGSPLVNRPLSVFAPTLNSRAAAGAALADLALGLRTPPENKTYAALRRARLTWPDPSEPARDGELAERLWKASARLAGI